jgi:Flp pilus assembly protein TadD
MLSFSISKVRSQTTRSLSGARLTLPLIAALLLAGCGTVNDTGTVSQAAKKPKVMDVKVLALAEEAIEQKRYKDARILIQRILLNDAKNKNAQVLWAELLLATGAPRDGIRFFEANKDDPALGARALQGMGLALLWMRQNEKAKEDLEKAVAKDPTLWRAWNALGYYYDSRGAWKLSSKAYEKAIDLNRTSALLFNNRGYSRLLQQKIKESIEDFRIALRLNPRLEIAQLNLRLAVAWSGQYEQALLGGEEKDLPRILNNVGFVALVRGNLVTAEGLLLRAVEADAAYNATARKNLYYLNSLKKTKKENKKQKIGD